MEISSLAPVLIYVMDLPQLLDDSARQTADSGVSGAAVLIHIQRLHTSMSSQ